MGAKPHIEATPPKFLLQVVEEKEMAQKDHNLMDSPPVFWVDFSAFAAQQEQTMAEKVVTPSHLTKVKLVFHNLSQPVKVKCLMRVVLLSAQLMFQRRTNSDSLAVGNVVSNCGAYLLI